MLLHYLRRTARRWPLAAGGDEPAQQCCVVVGAQCPLYREASQPALHRCHHGKYFLLNHVMYMCLMRDSCCRSDDPCVQNPPTVLRLSRCAVPLYREASRQAVKGTPHGTSFLFNHDMDMCLMIISCCRSHHPFVHIPQRQEREQHSPLVT